MKHIKVTSNDKIIFDKRIKCCYDCPLYYQDVDYGSFCNADDEDETIRNEMDEIGFFTDERIARSCPLEDAKEC